MKKEAEQNGFDQWAVLGQRIVGRVREETITGREGYIKYFGAGDFGAGAIAGESQRDSDVAIVNDEDFA